MARTPSTAASSPASSRASKPAMSATQAAASTALAALLARKRGVKAPRESGVRRLKRRPKVPVEVDVGSGEAEKGRQIVVERNVRALKKAGKVGEGEREVRRRILKMREEQKGKGKAKGKGKGKKAVEEDDGSD